MPASERPAAGRHRPFRYRTVEALRLACAQVGVSLPLQPDINPLFEALSLGRLTVPNRLAVQPMEGCDAFPDGSPSDLTFERYRRFGAGGSGLIWFEATAIAPGGRANRRQLMLTRRTLPAFRRLALVTREAAAGSLGGGHRPVLVLQLTHSGRFSFRDPGAPVRVACANPHLDIPDQPSAPWTDDELDGLADQFAEATALAGEAGFDLVDIKACHGYLVHELLGAHTRLHSRYGGSFDNRIRFLAEAIVRSTARTGPGFIAVRMNATDGIPHPWGFGTGPGEGPAVDLREPCELARRLAAAGTALLNVTAGIPARVPHIGRPFDRAAGGGPPPAEHPLVGVERLLRVTEAIQHAVPATPVVGTGYSWLRAFWPQVGAAVVAGGGAAAVGLGRGVFAYPDAPLDLLRRGQLDPSKCCVACSSCSELMRARVPTGCVVRDHARYRPLRLLEREGGRV